MAEVNFKKLLVGGEPNDPPKGQLAYEKEPTICTKCIFYQERQCNRVCIARIKKIMDFVTGKEIIKGYRLCREVNTDGKCLDYREKEE